MNPSKRENEFMVKFIDNIARRAMGAPGVEPNIEPAAKRMRPDGGMAGMAAAMGGGMFGADPYKEQQIQTIKAYQKQGPEERQAWSEFTDQLPGRKKDPNAYDSSVLKQFLDAIGAKIEGQPMAAEANPWAGGMDGMGAAAGGMGMGMGMGMGAAA